MKFIKHYTLFFIWLFILNSLTSISQTIDRQNFGTQFWGRLNPNGGQGNVSALGVGLFPSPTAPSAGLHISPFGLGNPYWNGSLFRTDGDQVFNNSWRIFTGASGRFMPEIK